MILKKLTSGMKIEKTILCSQKQAKYFILIILIIYLPNFARYHDEEYVHDHCIVYKDILKLWYFHALQFFPRTRSKRCICCHHEKMWIKNTMKQKFWAAGSNTLKSHFFSFLLFYVFFSNSILMPLHFTYSNQIVYTCSFKRCQKPWWHFQLPTQFK